MAAAANDEARVGSSFDDGLHACTRRIRQHTFPFYSVGLDLLYGMALLTRLFLLTFAILCRRNFGCGLAQRVHWRSKEDGDMGHGQPSLLSQSSSLPTEDSCVATHAAHPDGCHRTGSATSGGGSYASPPTAKPRRTLPLHAACSPPHALASSAAHSQRLAWPLPHSRPLLLALSFTATRRPSAVCSPGQPACPHTPPTCRLPILSCRPLPKLAWRAWRRARASETASAGKAFVGRCSLSAAAAARR